MTSKNKKNEVSKAKELPRLLFLIFLQNLKKSAVLSALLLLSFLQAQGQNVLTLEEAKNITLANNFGIKVAKNNVTLAENNADKKANGYLPTVGATAGLNTSLGGSSQSFNNGMDVSVSNAFTWGGNAALNVNYTLWDKRRDLTLNQQKENISLSELQLLQTIEQNLLQVYNSYFQTAQLAENIEALEQAIAISRERLQRAEYQLEYGQGNGLNILNAEVDIQRDSVNLLNAKQNLANAQRNLNVLMGRNIDEDFQVSTDLTYAEGLVLNTLTEEARQGNLNLQVNRRNLAINELNLGIIDAERKPTLTAGASYTFSYSDNPDQAFITSSNNRGVGANVGLNWNIFDGSRKIREQNTRLNLSNQKLQITDLERQTEAQVINAWQSYQNALFVLEVQESAVKTNEENFARTEEQLRIGRITSIEFRQAQLNLLNAQTQLNNAKYDAKLREIQLLQLAGKLP